MEKILSIAYLVVWGIIFAVIISEGRYENITMKDFLISKISDIIILTFFISPYIFLSQTKFREKIPLFKKHKIWANIIGFLIIYILTMLLNSAINELHTEEYLADMESHAYKEITTEATCENDGVIKRVCEYCGLTNNEIIPALGHTMAVISNDDSSLVKECEVCKKQEITENNNNEAEKSEAPPSPSVESDKKEEINKKDEIIYEVVDLQTMIDELKANALKAEQTYLKKYVEVVGKISNFDSDGAYISIEPVTAGAWNFDNVMCKIANEEQINLLLEKSVGDKITVKGQITSIGEVMGYMIKIAEIY